MAWIELHTNLPRHPKTMQLQERLRVKAPTVIGHLCLLWMWTLENAPDGRLNRMDAKALAKICQIPARRAEEFLDALLACGFLDPDEQGLRLHDWETYAGRYNEQRRKQADRKRQYRAKQRDGTVPGQSQDSPGTSHPNQTIPNQTEPDRTIPYPSLSSGAGGDGAGGPGQAAEYLDSQGLLGSNYVQASPKMRERSDALTDELFAAFCSRTPTLLDRVRVFTALGDDTPAGGRDDKADLLRYAFQQAAQADRPGVWPYIEGVLGRLYRRGITDRDAAEDYDYERAFG